MSKFSIGSLETEFRERVREALRLGRPVLDVGRGEAFGHKQTDTYGLTLPGGVEYVSLDVSRAPSPDVVGSLHELPFRVGTFSLVFLESILEHMWPLSRIERGVAEARRVLAEGGLAVGWVPFCFPFHGEDYPDSVRFTREGIEHLLEEFQHVRVEPEGGPLSVFLAGLPVVGHPIRRSGLQALETKLIHAVFDRWLTRYEYQRRRISCVGFRFFAQK